MAAGFGARNDQNIDPGLGVLDGVFARTGQRADRHALGPGLFHHEVRRHTQGVDNQLDGMVKGDIKEPSRALGAQIFAVPPVGFRFPQIINIEPMACQQIANIGPVFWRDARFELRRRRRLTFGDNLVGNKQIDTIGLAVHMFVDPVEFNFQAFRCMADRPQHAKAAGVGYRRDDIPAVGEGEQWKFNA